MVSNSNQPLEMKGFKGFHYDPKEGKFFCQPRYKKYYFSNKKNNHVDGAIRMCTNGLHFCPTMADVKNYFCSSRYDVFYAEVLASGTIVNKDNYFFTEGYYVKLDMQEMQPQK